MRRIKVKIGDVLQNNGKFYMILSHNYEKTMYKIYYFNSHMIYDSIAIYIEYDLQNFGKI